MMGIDNDPFLMNDSSKRPILIRSDAGGYLGAGHIMRMIALGQSLLDREIPVCFASMQCPQPLSDRIEREGFSFYTLKESALGGKEDAKETKRLAIELDCQWVVLDGYHFDLDYQKTLRTDSLKVAIMEDHDHCKEWYADLIVNQNLGSEKKSHQNTLLTGKSLCGSFYTLLRREFRTSEVLEKKGSWPPRNLLLTMGGVDPDNATGLVLEGIEGLASGGLCIKVVLSSQNPNKNDIEELARQSKHRVEILFDVIDMPALYRWAEVAVTAGGSTCYEWMYYHLPAAVVKLADNQEPIFEALKREPRVLLLGQLGKVDAGRITHELRNWFGAEVPPRFNHAVDGQGSRRVAAYLENRLTISIVTDEESWVNSLLKEFFSELQDQGHRVYWVHQAEQAPASDLLFLLSYWGMVPKEIRKRHTHVLVVHESELPKGRGWSPLTWQVLEGKNEIPICLFEAVDKVDAGSIYLSDKIRLEGHELIDGIRESQAKATVKLCQCFVNEYPSIITNGKPQQGSSSTYPRWRPRDSELDPDKSISEQFNHLRIVDNKEYPAFFEHQGHRYRLQIEREKS